MNIDERKEFIFYYESRQNPNGDPGFENMPRQMPDGRILVTDVRVKRTVRDYARSKHGKTLFVDFGSNGKPTTADKRAAEIVGEGKNNLEKLLIKTFDVPLFGALVTIRRGKKKGGNGDETEEKGDSFKVTGPVQFGLGRSVNQVEIVNPSITGRFVGDEKKGQHSTIGKFYSVEYALIKFQGAVNPANLGKRFEDKEVKNAFDENEKLFFDCLWNGTNELITRSKYPQRSVFYLDVTYDGSCYNDLGLLVDEDEKMKGKATCLDSSPLKFDKLETTLKKRKNRIKQVRIASCTELEKRAEELSKRLKDSGIKVELVEC